MFADIVGSTERAVEMGDRGWLYLLERYYEIMRGQLKVFRGNEVSTVGDGFFASFDGPARAVRSALAQGIQQGTLITLVDGQVQGHLNGATREFLGIPYAAPPSGPLPWRPPAPVTAWKGVLDAASYPPACPQVDGLTATPSENEDCPYLNAWPPEPAPAAGLPVMVWIHGGGNVSGWTGNVVSYPPYEGYRMYDAHSLAGGRNVVVVSLNYRLGVFGLSGW